MLCENKILDLPRSWHLLHRKFPPGLLRGTEDEIDKAVRWIPERDKKERVGFPTQKPIGLYSRMILSSTQSGDIVFDPFAGCATTLVAAERLDRQWVGMDIWDQAYEVVKDRMGREVGMFGDVTFTAKSPERTDDGEIAAPFLRVKVRVKEPEGPHWTRAQMYKHLLEQYGARCQGCYRTFDDPRYLELDHKHAAIRWRIEPHIKPHPFMRPL